MGVAVPGGRLGAGVSGDLLLGFRPGAGPVRPGSSWGYPLVGQEPEHIVLAVAQALRRSRGGRLRVSGIHLAEFLAGRLQDGG